MTEFADSTDPALIDPAQFSHVAAYGNGRYAWPAAQLARFPRHILIGVMPGQPQQARTCRVLDVERFDATPADVPGFVEERHLAGHHDATIYCDLASTAAVLGRLEAAKLAGDDWRLWLAWYWGKPVAPTAAQVIAELKAGFGVTLDERRLWACQWKPGGPYDESALYGADDFARA